MTNLPPGAPPPGSPWAWHLQETYKGLITLCVEALKMLGLINGGAAVALLTYAGALITRTPGSHPPSITSALLWYCSGLIATVVAFLAAYLTQLRLYAEERARHEGTAFRQRHSVGITLGIVCAVYGAVAFGLGCLSAARALIPP